MILRVLSGALLAGALLVSCGSAPPATPQGVPGDGAASAPAPSPAEPEISIPWAVAIPKLGVRSTLIPLGLNPDGSMEVPAVTDPLQAGYYAGENRTEVGDEVLPGQVGSAVIAAHVDGVIDGQRGRPGLFYRLHELAPGDEVLVETADGRTLRFVIEEASRYPKDAFPSGKVFERDDRPRLNLITCTGSYDREARSYRDNLVAHAVLTEGQAA